MAGGGDGSEDDPLAVGRYSQLLFSDDVDDLSADGCFDFTPSFSSPKMLCFGGYNEEESDLTFDNKSSTIISQKIGGVSITCSDSSSASSTNSNKKRNVSGLGFLEEKNQKKSVEGINGNIVEKLAPVRSQRNCKKTKSDYNSSDHQTGRHAKVKKEKLGERIVALQQLVSPFGKSDTASVLHEAMGYIRFLQDQVQVLCSPYLQRLPSSSSAHLHHHEGGENGEGEEGEGKKDLRSKGLCLVPVELTLHVADDNGADFWSPAMVNTTTVSSNQ
ncbi:hypothetical protein M9H77_20476 [Catharanthus roseus]|uniref:Uncharacterized protein n=1 Tax=Catharanthus roseus TaxID=4058 RepID=A0ACC0AJQ6_CATRO|nr:hypothetical protein M9H77_20476 [Catharanthus roseus]